VHCVKVYCLTHVVHFIIMVNTFIHFYIRLNLNSIVLHLVYTDPDSIKGTSANTEYKLFVKMSIPMECVD